MYKLARHVFRGGIAGCTLPTHNPHVTLHRPVPVGNGYLATVLHSPTIYLAGVFNGDQMGSSKAGAPHRARVPAYLVEIANTSHGQAVEALNIREAVYYRRTV